VLKRQFQEILTQNILQFFAASEVIVFDLIENIKVTKHLRELLEEDLESQIMKDFALKNDSKEIFLIKNYFHKNTH
jgi:hypothetical protein